MPNQDYINSNEYQEVKRPEQVVYDTEGGIRIKGLVKFVTSPLGFFAGTAFGGVYAGYGVLAACAGAVQGVSGLVTGNEHWKENGKNKLWAGARMFVSGISAPITLPINMFGDGIYNMATGKNSGYSFASFMERSHQRLLFNSDPNNWMSKEREAKVERENDVAAGSFTLRTLNRTKGVAKILSSGPIAVFAGFAGMAGCGIGGLATLYGAGKYVLTGDPQEKEKAKNIMQGGISTISLSVVAMKKFPILQAALVAEGVYNLSGYDSVHGALATAQWNWEKMRGRGSGDYVDKITGDLPSKRQVRRFNISDDFTPAATPKLKKVKNNRKSTTPDH